MGNAREAALAVLGGAQAGSISRAAMEALATAVLERDDARLALEVRAGGPFAIRNAIELAAVVLAQSVDVAVRVG